MRRPAAVAFWGAGVICMPGAIDDRAGEGSPAAGRAGWLAVQPQAPSTRAPTTIQARMWPERAARVPPVPPARVPIEVLVTVILPWQRLTAYRRNCRPSRTAALAASRRLRW